MASMKHSDKALTTLSLMETKPEEWVLTEIKWVEEERTIPGWVTCPDCLGYKYVQYDADGTLIPPPTLPPAPSFDLYGTPVYKAYEKACKDREEYNSEARRLARTASPYTHGNCRRCTRKSRGWFVPQGTVKGLVKAKVKVGYPQFPKGTVFTSRFVARESEACVCHLCSKTIVKSGRVPVNTTGAAPKGMWVGADCARKFLAVEIKRAKDSIMEDSK